MRGPMDRAIYQQVAITIALLLLSTITLSAHQCQFDRTRPTQETFEAVLEQHGDWLKAGGRFSDPRRANLCRADLRNFSLVGIDMRGANLSGALFDGSQLIEANLFGADLSGARSDVTGAILNNADLSGSWLVQTTLSRSRMLGANVAGVTFEPTELPDIDSIAYVKNLFQMQFGSSPQALIKLRKAFKEAGYYRQEKEVTYAIRHQETLRLLDIQVIRAFNLASLLEGVFRYVLFDVTTRWGMRPGRALLILLALIPVFVIPYVIALRREDPDASGASGRMTDYESILAAKSQCDCTWGGVTHSL